MAPVIVSDPLHVALFDTGDSILISGTRRENVELVLRQLVQLGSTVVDKPHETGSNWTASRRRPDIADDEVQVERLGYRFFIRGRSFELVRSRVAELTKPSARLEGEIYGIDDLFIAVCHDSSGDITTVD
jgi:hypothetical protein